MAQETNQTEEQWKTIKDYPMYEVSTCGRVRSNNNPKNPKILKQSTSKRGYKTVALVKEKNSNKAYTKQVHRLVAETWIENPDNKPCVDHKNCNPSDNNVTNLRWCTTEENANNAITKARVTAANQKRAIERSQMVLVYDKDYNLLSAFTSTADAARRLNYSQGNITNCCNGALPHYHNLYFSYTPMDIKAKEELDKQGEEKKQRRLQALKKATAKWQKTHREQCRQIARDNYYKKMYGMKEHEYKQMKNEGI